MSIEHRHHLPRRHKLTQLMCHHQRLTSRAPSPARPRNLRRIPSLWSPGAQTHDPGLDESVLLTSLKAATSNTNTKIFVSRNYKIRISFGLSPQCLSPVTCVYDTGSGPYLINWDNVPADDPHTIRPADILSFRTANKSALAICGMILSKKLCCFRTWDHFLR